MNWVYALILLVLLVIIIVTFWPILKRKIMVDPKENPQEEPEVELPEENEGEVIKVPQPEEQNSTQGDGGGLPHPPTTPIHPPKGK